MTCPSVTDDKEDQEVDAEFLQYGRFQGKKGQSVSCHVDCVFAQML